MRVFKVTTTYAYGAYVADMRTESIAKPPKPDSMGVSNTLRKKIKPP